MRARLAAACGLIASLAACSNFPVIEADECGNAVLEEDEDCDTFAEKGQSCRAKGSEGECHYDCRAGSDGTRYVCPDDMACASDGLCRRPTGEFEKKAQFATDVSSWLSTVDFDGDHHSELISSEAPDQLLQARFRLHYFDDDAQLVETRVFPRFTTRPVAREVTGDDAQDLMFSNLRVGMVPGRADHDWVPATFSSYVLENSGLRVVGVRGEVVDGGPPLVAISTLDDVPGVYVPNFSTGQIELHAKLPATVLELQGEPTAANVLEGGDSPCSELLIAFRGDRSFRMLDLCEAGQEQTGFDAAWRGVALEQIVTLPGGLKIDAAPVAADVDGDGHLDVLIGSGGRAYVVPGDGQQLLADAIEPLELNMVGEAEPFTDPPMPLAAADLSGDGVADFVLPTDVLSSKKTPDGASVVYTKFPNRGEPWTLAQIADLNGNGFPDVVAAAAGTPGLSFLNGTGGPHLIGARLATAGPVRLLSTGDYDGDLIDDVAFVVMAASPATKDSVSIAFGARDGLPEPATRVAEIAGVDQLGDSADSGMDTMFVTTNTSTEGVARSTLTLFDGSPDRLPFATYTLVTFSVDGRVRDSGADAIVAGAFTAPGANDVMAIGSSPGDANWSLWLLPDIGSASQPPRLIQATSPEGVVIRTEDGGGFLSVAGTAADLDGDGLDEALWLMPEGDGACALLAYGVDAEKLSSIEKARLHFDEPCALPALQAADLDHNQANDVVLLLGDARREPRQLRILWNDGSGLSLSNSTFMGDPQGRDIRAFNVFGGPKRSIAFVTDRQLHIAESLGPAGIFGVLRELDRFDDARAVVVTDPNGDDLDDIMVADAAGLWLLKAQLQ